MIFFLISSSFLGGGVDVIRLLLIFFLSCFWCLFFSRFEKRNQENLKWKTIFLSDFVRFWVEEQMRFLFFWFLCFFSLSFFFMFFVFFFAFLLLFFRVLNRFEEREKRFFFLIPFDFVFRSLPFSLFWADLSKEI